MSPSSSRRWLGEHDVARQEPDRPASRQVEVPRQQLLVGAVDARAAPAPRSPRGRRRPGDTRAAEPSCGDSVEGAAVTAPIGAAVRRWRCRVNGAPQLHRSREQWSDAARHRRPSPGPDRAAARPAPGSSVRHHRGRHRGDDGAARHRGVDAVPVPARPDGPTSPSRTSTLPLYDDRSIVRTMAMRRTLWIVPRDLLPAVSGSAGRRVADEQRRLLAKETADLEFDVRRRLDRRRRTAGHRCPHRSRSSRPASCATHSPTSAGRSRRRRARSGRPKYP